jgi:hypothetical protein
MMAQIKAVGVLQSRPVNGFFCLEKRPREKGGSGKKKRTAALGGSVNEASDGDGLL